MSELSPSTNGRASDGHQDWPNLIGQAVDDLSRIVHSEVDILQTRLGDSIRSELHGSSELIALVALSLWGAGCLLIGAILLLHLWLPLWLAFDLVGLFSMILGLFGRMKMKRRRRSIMTGATASQSHNP